MTASSPRSRRAVAQAWAIGLFVLVAGLLFQYGQRPEANSGQFVVRVLDVGQGDAILLETPHGRHVLIDGGPDRAVLTQLSRFIAPPRRLELVVASHNHADHITGLISVLGEYPIEEVWLSGATHTSVTFEKYVSSLGSVATVQTVRAGHGREIDGVHLRVLYPLQDFTSQEPDHQHHATIVVKASYGATSVLLAGDLESEYEAELLAIDPAVLRSDVLKVTHHGSHNASTDAFLEAVGADFGLISAAAGNSFGHPHQETLERLDAHNVRVLRTDRDGTITCRSNGIVIGCE